MNDLHPVVRSYRALNPQSRAVDHTTWDGSSAAVRRATCIYCRKIIATSSAEWPETQESKILRAEHWKSCVHAMPYMVDALEWEPLRALAGAELG